MQEFLKDIFLAVITAAVPVLTAYIVVLIRKVGENAAANAESVKAKTYITEAAEAIADAVAATNQTYVDALKNAGKFDAVAQKEAAQKALAACLASISPAAQSFIEAAYGDIREYLTTQIEAEVCSRPRTLSPWANCPPPWKLRRSIQKIRPIRSREHPRRRVLAGLLPGDFFVYGLTP